MRSRTVVVLDANYHYLSHCTRKKATKLIHSGRACELNRNMVRLFETSKERKEHMRMIIEQSHRICYICGRHIPEEEIATIDHVIPKSRDNTSDTYENMRCCCCRCNSDKRDMMPIEYIEYVITHRWEFKYLSNERIAYLKVFFYDFQKTFEKRKKKREFKISKYHHRKKKSG